MKNVQVSRECRRIMISRGLLPFNHPNRLAERKRLRAEPSHLDHVFSDGTVFRDGQRQPAEPVEKQSRVSSSITCLPLPAGQFVTKFGPSSSTSFPSVLRRSVRIASSQVKAPVTPPAVRQRSPSPRHFLTNSCFLTCTKCGASVAVTRGMFATHALKFVCNFAGQPCKRGRAKAKPKPASVAEAVAG